MLSLTKISDKTKVNHMISYTSKVHVYTHAAIYRKRLNKYRQSFVFHYSLGDMLKTIYIDRTSYIARCIYMLTSFSTI